MSFIDRLSRRIRRALGPRQKKIYSDEKTIPLSSKLLAQALSGEGRRHITMGFGISSEDSRSSDQVSLYTLLGNSDGHNVLPDFGLIGVAEGNGSRTNPKISDLAIKVFSEWIIRGAINNLLALDSGGDTLPFQDAVKSGFSVALEAVTRLDENVHLSMTAGFLFAEIIILGHRGNTRAYIIDRTHIEQITPHPTDKATSKGSGNKLADQESNSNHVNEDQNSHIFSRPVPRDGYILLTSAALSDSLGDEDIQGIVNKLKDPQLACDALLLEAERAGARRDISIILLYFPPDFGSWR